MLTEEEIQKLKGVVPEYRNIFPPNLDHIYNNQLVKLLGEANRAIGNLNSSKKIIPNPDLLVGPVLLKEALASSKIEGTQTTIRDVVQEEANIAFEDEFDQIQAREVVNHMAATRAALELINQISISSRLLKTMHELLLRRVRGKQTTLGDFRIGNNAIKKDGKIIYLPPDTSQVADLVSKLEVYINDPDPTDQYDPLLRAAVAHYQFEVIHPFADGNGRLGRAIISLQLIREGVLRYPVLYLSGYLLRKKEEYDNYLLNVTTQEDWTTWITFFLEGIKEQATKSEEIVNSIYDLYDETKQIARQNIKSSNVETLITLIFKNRSVNANDVARELNITHGPAIDLLRKLNELGILTNPDPEKKRDIQFINEPLVKLLERV